MNKAYLQSLGIYLVFNSIVWLILSGIVGGLTTSSFMMSTLFAVLIHKYFIYGRKSS